MHAAPPPAHIRVVAQRPGVSVLTAVTENGTLTFSTTPPSGSVVVATNFCENNGEPCPQPAAITDANHVVLTLEATADPLTNFTGEWLYDYQPTTPTATLKCAPNRTRPMGSCYRDYGVALSGVSYPAATPPQGCDGPAGTTPSCTVATNPGDEVVCAIYTDYPGYPDYSILGASGVTQIEPNVRAAALYGVATATSATVTGDQVSTIAGWEAVCADYAGL